MKYEKMLTLQDVCYNSLAASMESAPPLLQEKIMGNVYDRVKQNTKKDVKQEIKQELLPQIYQQTQDDYRQLLPFLISEIVKDNIKSTIVSGYIRKNFAEKYKHLNKNIVHCAIQTAELTVTSMEEHYTYRAFEFSNPTYHGYFNESGDESYDES
jgi:hypothetical protein